MQKSFTFEKEKIIEEYNTSKKSLEETLDNIQIKIIEHKSRFLEFDLIGVNCSIANALRRILIDEIPTMAIEDVRLRSNTTVMPDEMLCNRLGLLPLCVNPDHYEFYDGEVSENNTLTFSLSVKNTENTVMRVTSDHIVWCPIGSQKETLGNVKFSPNILIVKLAPLHSLDVELYCRKNIGKVHAKWSPVCPASYRLMPIIEIADIYDKEAVKLKGCFSDGVIGLRGEGNRVKAYVENPRLDSMSREALRHKEFENRVKIGRRADWYIFTIESVYLDPLWLLRKAVYLLIKRAEKLREEVDNFE